MIVLIAALQEALGATGPRNPARPILQAALNELATPA